MEPPASNHRDRRGAGPPPSRRQPPATPPPRRWRTRHSSANRSARWTYCSMMSRDSGIPGSGQALEHRVDEERSEAEGELVSDEKGGRGDEGPGQREHLLLASGQVPRQVSVGRPGSGRTRRPVRWRRAGPVDRSHTVAMRRLSMTVSLRNTPRPSGRWTTPAWRTRCGGSAVMSRPFERHCPRRGRDQAGNGPGQAALTRLRWDRGWPGRAPVGW